jgi:2-(1,2-epoxy-1,2-dihydrophenyl)acetyl-CoA isomerase
MSSDEIVFTVDDGIATIRLNRPERLNAFTYPMLDAWADALEEYRRDEAVRAVVLTGTGRGFCSGGDVRAMGERHKSGETAFQRKQAVHERIHRIPLILENFDKPYIVAINGVATGAGLDMALMGDIRFAAASARMAETYIKVGLISGDGGAWYLPRLVGVPRALELLWTGDFIDAHEAERIGLVNKVLPDDKLMDHTYAFAQRLAGMPALTLRLMKRAVYQGLRTDLRASLDALSSHLGVISTTNDHREAVAAFNEKRPAKFTDS